MWREFKAFLLKQNLMALALAVVVGTATNNVVQSIVTGFIMPLIGLVTPGEGWRQWRIPLGPSLAERMAGGGADSVAASDAAAAAASAPAGSAAGTAQNALLIGEFLAALLNFLIVGFVAWQITKLIIKPSPPDAKSATRPCPYCRQQIDAAATRCAHCTSEVEATATAAA